MGITFLARHYQVVPRTEETVVSQLARLIFGGGLLYYEIQVVTMLILVFAANTAFADFPRLAYFLARDGFIPRQFGTRGDRLVFSNGILILGGLAALLILLFGGATHALIPLYAVGVFVSFTLSQASMVRRWLSRRLAVKPARFENREAVALRKTPRQRTLARGRGPVDGDDHDRASAMAPPSAFIAAAKPGKLVAIVAPSSMRTGRRAAMPRTRNDMAMR